MHVKPQESFINNDHYVMWILWTKKVMIAHLHTAAEEKCINFPEIDPIGAGIDTQNKD